MGELQGATRLVLREKPFKEGKLGSFYFYATTLLADSDELCTDRGYRLEYCWDH